MSESRELPRYKFELLPRTEYRGIKIDPPDLDLKVTIYYLAVELSSFIIPADIAKDLSNTYESLLDRYLQSKNHRMSKNVKNT